MKTWTGNKKNTIPYAWSQIFLLEIKGLSQKMSIEISVLTLILNMRQIGAGGMPSDILDLPKVTDILFSRRKANSFETIGFTKF